MFFNILICWCCWVFGVVVFVVLVIVALNTFGVIFDLKFVMTLFVRFDVVVFWDGLVSFVHACGDVACVLVLGNGMMFVGGDFACSVADAVVFGDVACIVVLVDVVVFGDVVRVLVLGNGAMLVVVFGDVVRIVALAGGAGFVVGFGDVVCVFVFVNFGVMLVGVVFVFALPPAVWIVFLVLCG